MVATEGSFSISIQRWRCEFKHLFLCRSFVKWRPTPWWPLFCWSLPSAFLLMAIHSTDEMSMNFLIRSTITMSTVWSPPPVANKRTCPTGPCWRKTLSATLWSSTTIRTCRVKNEVGRLFQFHPMEFATLIRWTVSFIYFYSSHINYVRVIPLCDYVHTTYKCLINLIPKGKLHLVETWQTFLTSLIFQICSDEKYRSFDGSCNNLKNPSWGMKNLKFLKFSTDCILHIPVKFFWGNCFSIILDKT